MYYCGFLRRQVCLMTLLTTILSSIVIFHCHGVSAHPSLKTSPLLAADRMSSGTHPDYTCSPDQYSFELHQQEEERESSRIEEFNNDNNSNNNKNGYKQVFLNFADKLKNAIGLQIQSDDEDNNNESIIENIFSVNLSQYENEIVLRFKFENLNEQKEFVRACETLVLDLWTVQDDYADVRLDKSRLRDLLRLLPKGMRHTSSRHLFLIEDLQRAVLASIPLESNNIISSSGGIKKGDKFFEDYQSLKEIYKYMKNNFSNVENIGNTFNNNSLNVITLGNGPIDVVVTAGLQGREWLAINSLLYAINEFQQDDENILKAATFKFIPVSNPDGFEYTWSTDRLWRKNRQATGVSMCSGMDIQSSLVYEEKDVLITACSESFAGKYPLQSIEASRISELIRKTDIYIDLSSYTQQLIGNKSNEKLTRKIRKSTGRDYKVVNEASKVHNFEAPKVVSYKLALPNLDGTGFLAHKRHIEPIGREVGEILKNLVKEEIYVMG